MAQYFVGVDGGATATKVVVLNSKTGETMGQASAESSNYHNVGKEKARAAIKQAVTEACQIAKIEISQIAGIACGIAGVHSPADIAQFDGLHEEIGLSAPLHFENDILAALSGGAGSCTSPGIAIICGTGTAVFGRDKDGKTARAAGWGYLMDSGSAYDISLQALRQCVRADDGVYPQTNLTQRLLKDLKLEAPRDFVNWMYHPDRTVTQIAGLAPAVFDEAEKGDIGAMGIAAQACDILADNVLCVARKLNMTNFEVPLVLVGGVHDSKYFHPRFCQSIAARLPFMKPVFPAHSAAVGAALIALDRASVPNPFATKDAASSDAPAVPLRATEHQNLYSLDIDLLSPEKIVGLLHTEDKRAVNAISTALPAISEAVGVVTEAFRQGGRLFNCGSGTPGRLSVVDAAEVPPTFTDTEHVFGLIAGGHPALVKSNESIEDLPDEGAKAVREYNLCSKDVVCGITASGRTPYCLGAIQEAKKVGAKSIAIVCALPSVVAEAADTAIFIPTGAEVVTGSTRMKGGTVQKLVLNIISTCGMVGIGKTLGNLMVDLSQHNSKLVDRAERIVAKACNIEKEEAVKVLDACERKVNVAIVHKVGGVDVETAKKTLAENSGVVRKSLVALNVDLQKAGLA
eukprot:TRINITY_DN67076_c9_g2_i1.p2 TRINITY_DN67076_c9_g2~~TRINITY_DN67076_c9_g2_i1.p2  ORF type:complete len:631 (-),score=58.69 TRINITY_DN67076_c9_g2_i1:2460-4352(-)